MNAFDTPTVSTAHHAQDTALLTTVGLAVGYTARRVTTRVLDGVNVTLRAGELVCLIGPNGAGKSTLMRTLAGMQPPLAGTITLAGDELTALSPAERARRLSIVLTERIDAGLLTAHALVALGRHPYTGWLGTLRPEDEAVVIWALEAVGALDLAARPVNELSDGERQKVMIARALAQEPALLLLDEPTAFLDLPRRAEVLTMLRRLARETERAILLSTHDLDLALRTADRIWLLPKGGPLHVGAPEDLVLSGAFEAAFRGEGVTFDAYSGSFRSSSQAAGLVALRGEGLPALWTQRALERAGYCVAPDAPLVISITQDAGATRWQVSGDARVFHDLAALIEALNTLPKS
ncbi:MAG: ABC transporter ATP-binding protein [Anaerolineae bacterium]|nr:ABC transporter ATP-binding protein [Anaerolineae bacterium]